MRIVQAKLHTTQKEAFDYTEQTKPYVLTANLVCISKCIWKKSLKEPYSNLLISDQSVDDSYNEVLSNSKVVSSDTLRAVHNEGNVQGSALSL